ncbi:unnamed protein product [Gemmata massiliana]|uniref:Uncharacterized protein n=1 Tax=Gemmata massiliana TaxID=1210884 RepID=A0A6P2DIL2_9BACT|nr:hypothetical protein [Gemmata massiliana]VTS02870.1 unnamed protein product [Gemmata massiliana]
MLRLPVLRHRAPRPGAKYRACRHPVEKTRWHLVWLLLRTDEPRPPAPAAALVGCRSSPRGRSSTDGTSPGRAG